MKIESLEIRLGGRVIGHLYSLGSASAIRFADGYLLEPTESRPVLSLSLARQQPGLPDARKRHRYYPAQLPPFFENLLPEGSFLDLISRTTKIDRNDRFAILAALGEDLPGAVALAPGSAPGPALEYDGDTYEAQIATLADGPIRFSLAGTQLKFSVYEREGKLVFRAGGVGGRSIVKLPHSRYPSVPENEYTCLRLAEAVGVDIPQIALIRTENVEGIPVSVEELKDTYSFVTSRFDRNSADGKIHIEDVAQALGAPPGRKYDFNFDTVVNLVVNSVLEDEREAAIEQLVKRSLVNVLIGNSDGHAKNWSLIYRDGVHPALAPAYDVLSTIPYIHNHDVGLKIGGSQQFREVNEGAYLRLAKRVGISPEFVARAYWQTLEAALDTWPGLLRQLPAGDYLTGYLGEHWRRLTVRGSLPLPEPGSGSGSQSLIVS